MSVTPDDVCLLTRPTDGTFGIHRKYCAILILIFAQQILNILAGFLCPLSANNYGIDFLSFTISDYETKKIIFEVGRDNPTPQDMSVDFSSLGEDMYRKIKYEFSEDVLRLPYIETS